MVSQTTMNMTMNERVSDISYKKMKNQTKSVATLSPKSDYYKKP